MPSNKKDQPKASKEVLIESLAHIGKIISIIVIIFLVLIGLFLIYYVVTTNFFKQENPAKGNPKFSVYTIVSGSMEPNIKVYDVIIDIRIDDPTKIKVGDVITFVSTSSHTEGMIITHRVIEVRKIDNKYEFVTQGDNNPTADPSTAKEDKLIGKTILRIPQLGRLQVFLSSKFGWIVAILIPALGVIIFDVVKLFKVLGVKGTSEQVEGTDVDYINKNEEDKKIAQTFEKIKKNNNLTNLDDHNSDFKLPPVTEEAIPQAEPEVKIDNSPSEVQPIELVPNEVDIANELDKTAPFLKTVELPRLVEAPNSEPNDNPVVESKEVPPKTDDPFAILASYVEDQKDDK